MRPPLDLRRRGESEQMITYREARQIIVYCKSPLLLSLQRFDSTDWVSVLVIAWGVGLDRSLLGADDVRGPVAPAADGVEGEVRGALVDPPGDALARRPRAAHHELAARVRVREHADVEALHLAVREDLHLKSMQETVNLYCLLSQVV